MIENAKVATKPGYKTTEFWVNLGFNIVCIVAMAFWPEKAEAWIAIAAMGLSNAGYAVSRGQAKNGI